MGRKTHESIGRVLPNRDNVVVTRQADYRVRGAFVFHDLDEAIAFAAERHSEAFIVGGQQLYEQTIRRADRLYLTSFKLDSIEGDTYFPEFPENMFKIIYTERAQVCGDYFRILQRKVPSETYTQSQTPLYETNTVTGSEDDWPGNSAYYWGLHTVGVGYGI
jgi:dihydrofolate reductase